MFLKEVSYAYQNLFAIISLIANKLKTLILWNIITIYIYIYIILYIKIENITPVLSTSWSFRNNSNMMICCSKTFLINKVTNISAD